MRRHSLVLIAMTSALLAVPARSAVPPRAAGWRRMDGQVLRPGAAAVLARGGSAADVAAAARDELDAVLPRRSPDARAAGVNTWYELLVGDAGGRGEDDFLVVAETAGDAATANALVQARDGVTGKVRWSTRVRPTALACSCTVIYYSRAFAALANGRADGVLVVAVATGFENLVSTADPTDTSVRRLRVGYDLVRVRPDGKVAWRASVHGSKGYGVAVDDVTYRQYPRLVGTLNSEPGRDLDLLFTTDDGRVVAGKLDQHTTRLAAYDGRTGRARTIRDETATPEYDYTPVRDLSGDGRDDVVVAPGNGGSGDYVARATSDGHEVWRLAEAAYRYPWALPDLTGDRRGEVAVLPYGTSLDRGGQPERRVQVLDGRTGRGFTVSHADSIDPVGDVDRDGHVDVVLGGVTADDATVTVTATAYTGRGRRLRSVHHRFAVPSRPDRSRAGAVGVVGDLDRDRALDVELVVEVTQDDGTTSRTTRVGRAAASVRTGRAFPSGTLWYGIGLTVDGRGDDEQDVSRPGLLTVRDGATGRAIWRVRGSRDVWLVAVGRQDGDRCPDLTVASYQDGYGTRLTVLRGATGRPMWSAGFGGTLPQPVAAQRLRHC